MINFESAQHLTGTKKKLLIRKLAKFIQVTEIKMAYHATLKMMYTVWKILKTNESDIELIENGHAQCTNPHFCK